MQKINKLKKKKTDAVNVASLGPQCSVLFGDLGDTVSSYVCYCV